MSLDALFALTLLFSVGIMLSNYIGLQVGGARQLGASTQAHSIATVLGSEMNSFYAYGLKSLTLGAVQAKEFGSADYSAIVDKQQGRGFIEVKLQKTYNASAKYPVVAALRYEVGSGRVME